jgi:glutamate racemase
MDTKGAIGVFDSGYGGLTVLKEIVQQLPDYHYLYLGDNARAPYGTRTFETVYHYTLESVQWFFDQGCELVILACNTASAKALRTIQQNDLSRMGPSKRVLGVIRPTTEVIGDFSATGQIGILGTKGTVQSLSYIIEIEKFFPNLKVFQEACPMWVPLIENNEHLSPGADYFIQKNLDQLFAQSVEIDTILLACTHYPLLIDKLKSLVPQSIQVIEQGAIVAKSLANYLERHPELESKCVRNSRIDFFTTDATADFDAKGSLFFGKPIQSRHVTL